MDMRKLLETVTKFAGQEVGQKPGDQVKGTDIAKKGTKEHPFAGKLVGGCEESILKDLSKGPRAKTLEETLAEELAQFNEDDLGVEPKRPGRKSDRPAREYTKDGKPSKRYTKVKDVEEELEISPQELEYNRNELYRKHDDELGDYGVVDTGGQFAAMARAKKAKRAKDDEVAEGWESGPDEPSSYERDPDAEYDARRQERADADAQAAQAKRPQTKVYTLTGRGPNMEPNYKFPGEYSSQEAADAARKKLMADPKTPNPRMIGISTHTKYLDEDVQSQTMKNARKVARGVWRIARIGDDDGYEWLDRWDSEIGRAWNDYYEIDLGLGELEFEDYLAQNVDPQILAQYAADVTSWVNDAKFDLSESTVDEGINWPKEVPTDAEQEHEHNRDEEENDPHPYTPIDEDGTEEISSWGIPHNEWVEFEEVAEQALAAVQSEEAWKEFWQVADLDRLDKSMQQAIDYGLGSGDLDEFITDVLNGLRAGYEHYGTEPRAALDLTTMLLNRGIRRLSKPVVDEATAEKTYVVNITRRRSFGGEEKTRTTSGTISELLDYFGYTLEVGKAYEHERGRYKINMQPKNIKSLVDNLNKAASNGAANGAASTYYTVGEEHQITESIESADPIEGAVLNAVQELIQQGHTEVAPEVITNMVVAATSQPFLLKDLVDANKNSPAIQHYIDSINPSKVKFSSDILTVKNENPAKSNAVKQKAQAQSAVSSMASRAANRSRLGESGYTPLIDKEDYNAKKSQLQKILMDPDTAKDAELRAELARRSGALEKEAQAKGIKESKVVPVITAFRKSMEKIANSNMNPQAKQAAFDKLSAEFHKNAQTYSDAMKNKRKVDEVDQNPAVNPQAAAQAVSALNTLKTSTGTTTSAPALAKALDAASQGQQINAQDATKIKDVMGVVDQAAQDPKLANQFRTLATQAKQTQQKTAMGQAKPPQAPQAPQQPKM